jgi:hypothetical protein
VVHDEEQHLTEAIHDVERSREHGNGPGGAAEVPPVQAGGEDGAGPAGQPPAPEPPARGSERVRGGDRQERRGAARARRLALQAARRATKRKG